MSHGLNKRADMKRTAVIGNAGGGKSTLSRRLAYEHGLPYHELDALLWGPGWVARPVHVYEADHSQLVAGESWVIDGFGRLESLPARLVRATCVVLVDMPVWQHYSLAARRHYKWITGKLAHPPGGLSEVPSLDEVFKMIWNVDQQYMPKVRSLVTDLEAQGMAVTRLASPADVAGFTQTGH
ncbi:MAG: adenylate kinase [Parvibaculaceae bacterium]